MKDFFKALGLLILGAAVIYFIYFLFVPMRVLDKKVDREVTEQSQQYVTTQRQSLVTFYTAYTKADGDQKTAILGQMCEIKANLPEADVPSYIRSTLQLCR
jgi:hypothetical protein